MAAKKTVTVKFSDLVLAELNKSDDVKQKELVVETIEDYKIDINGQISALTTVELPRITNSIEKELRTLVKLKEAAEKTYLSILGGDFSEYVNRINVGKASVFSQENLIANLQSEAKDIKRNIEGYKEIKAKLNS